MESDRASVISDASTGVSAAKSNMSTTRKFAPALAGRLGQAKAAREVVQSTIKQPNPAVCY